MLTFTCLLAKRLIYLLHIITRMNTKVNKIKELYNMQLHKAKRINDLIDNHLPKKCYAEKVIENCEALGIPISNDIVRNVKNMRTKNSEVLNVILSIATENKKAQKKLEKY